MIRSLHLRGYRSLCDVRLPLAPLTIVTGANGTGKSNLYRALRLLSRSARGELAAAIVEEGGMPSALWSGPRRRRTRQAPPVQLAVEVQTDLFGYMLACGLPTPRETLFRLDPQVKLERAWLGPESRPSTRILERDHGSASVRTAGGEWIEYPGDIEPMDTALAQIHDPRRFPDVEIVRGHFLRWRFYHHLRCDPESPLRQPRLGTFCPSLASDGSDLVAALQTIREIGEPAALEAAIDRLQPGARLEIDDPEERGWLQVRLRTRGLLRGLDLGEWSDGTLRYIALVAALLSPRPAPLLAFNEPEASLHPDLLPALAEQFVTASRQGQIWVTTHSEVLVQALTRLGAPPPIRLHLDQGATRIVGQDIFGNLASIASEPVADDAAEGGGF